MRLHAHLAARDAGDTLLAIAVGSAHEGARQAAALFLRRHVVALWNRKRRSGARAALCAALLQRLAGIRQLLLQRRAIRHGPLAILAQPAPECFVFAPLLFGALLAHLNEFPDMMTEDEKRTRLQRY
jgi:hypothetical protein